MRRFICQIGVLGIIKTLWFNFRYLPFKNAFYIPVILSSKVKVQRMHRGGVILPPPRV